MNKKESFFRGKVHENAKKVGGSSGTDYLNIPKDFSVLKFDEKVKKVQVDFLPYIVTDTNHPDKDEKYGVALKGNLWYRRPFLLHQQEGADKKSYVCPRSIGKRCPICEHQQKLFDEDKREAAIALYPQQRELYIIVPLNSEKHEQIPYIWNMSEKMFHSCLKESLDENDSNEIFPDLEEGKTLELTFKWKKIGEKGKPFPETVWIDFFDRSEPWDPTVINQVPDLDEIIKTSVLTYEELKAIHWATDIEEDGGELTEVEEQPEVEEKKPFARRTIAKPQEQLQEEKPAAKRTLASTPTRTISRTQKPVEDVPEVVQEDEIDIPVNERCTACGGTGKNSKGKLCPICGGTGRKSKKVAPKPQESNDCPAGFTYGTDHGTQPECDDCDVYNECMEAKSKLRRK